MGMSCITLPQLKCIHTNYNSRGNISNNDLKTGQVCES